MKPEFILLRFGEITLKGKNRSKFEQRILSQIRSVLSDFPHLAISKSYGRLFIDMKEMPYEPIAERLKRVFGIVSFSPIYKVKLDIQDIQQKALEVLRGLHQSPNTFKVSVRRTNKAFPFDTRELNPMIGGYILSRQEGLRVDVHQPDIELQVEIRDEGAYIYCEVVPGLGGFPLGSNGKAMVMLSGGIDSPAAGWLAMRRGLRIEAVHFHSFPYTSERAKQKVIDLTRRLAQYGGAIRLHLVPFTDIQTGLHQQAQHNLLVTLMRRAMFRITEKLAGSQDAAAIITGESLGQVASQTLASIQVINSVTRMPVLRPLIMMDKNEIIEIAKKIDTYDISILPFEDCCTLFLPKSPSTNPNGKVVERIESRLSWLENALVEAVSRTETMLISCDNGQKGPLNELF